MKQVFLLLFLFILIASTTCMAIEVNVGNWIPNNIEGFHVNVGDDTAQYTNLIADEMYSDKYHIWNEPDQLYSSYLSFGDDEFEGSEHAMVLGNNDPSIPSGAITHYLYSQENKTLEAWQSGLNNSWGFHRNSYGIFSDNGFGNNLTHLTNAIQMWADIGINAEYDYNTADQGASLGVQYGIETQKLHIHNTLNQGSLSGEGDFSWMLDNKTHFEILGNGIHLLEKRIVEETTGVGNQTLADETFTGQPTGTQPPIGRTVAPDNVGSTIEEWSVRDDPRCFINPCMRAKGGDGNAIRGVEDYFPTFNITNMEISFYYGSDNMDATPTDYFRVSMNNNEGSGWVTIWLDDTTSADINPPIYKNFSVPASMEDRANITFKFEHSANLGIEESFVDNVRFTGLVGTPIQQNITYWDSNIFLGQNTNEEYENTISYNGTTKDISFSTNITIEDTQIKIKDTDAAGYTCCTALNGVLSCSICS